MARYSKQELTELLTGQVGLQLDKDIASQLDDDNVASKLSDAVYKTADYSRNMDKLRDEQKAWLKWREDSQVILDANNAEKQALADRLAKLYEMSNPNPPAAEPPAPRGADMTKEEFDTAMTARLQQFGGAVEQMTTGVIKLSGKYQHDWKEPMDVDGFTKFVEEKRYTDLNQAYDQFVAPKVAERDKATFDAAVAAAKEEGRLQGRSEGNFPIDGGAGDGAISPFRAARPADGTDPRAEFIKAYREAAAK